MRQEACLARANECIELALRAPLGERCRFLNLAGDWIRLADKGADDLRPAEEMVAESG